MHINLNYGLILGLQMIYFFMANPLKMKSHFNLKVINYKTVKLNLKNRKIYLKDKTIFVSNEKIMRKINTIYRI